jgi:hypothetical protein
MRCDQPSLVLEHALSEALYASCFNASLSRFVCEAFGASRDDAPECVESECGRFHDGCERRESVKRARNARLLIDHAASTISIPT